MGKEAAYVKAREVHDRSLPVTKQVYHRGSHMEDTIALKWAFCTRGVLEHRTVSNPLISLPDEAGKEIMGACKESKLSVVH